MPDETLVTEPLPENKHHHQLPDFLQVPWGVRDVVVTVVLWFVLQLALALMLGVLGKFMPVVHEFLAQASMSQAAASFVLDLAGVLIGLALVAVRLRHYKVGWKALGWRKVNVFKLLGYLFVIMVAFLILAQIALVLAKLLVPGFNADQPQTNEFTGQTATHRSIALVALVLMPPIFEETIFRGFIFPALAKRAGLIWGALLSSILFGIAHGQANLFVYTSILGLLLCFMYVRTKSILPGIALHMLNNYLAFLAISSK